MFNVEFEKLTENSSFTLMQKYLRTKFLLFENVFHICKSKNSCFSIKKLIDFIFSNRTTILLKFIFVKNQNTITEYMCTK